MTTVRSRQPLLPVSLACALASVASLSGCNGGEGPVEDETPTYVRDVQPLLAVKCGGCHTEDGIAPFPLVTYDQVTSVKGAVRAAVADRTMPPWLAGDGCTDYTGDRSLTDEQVDTVLRWIDGGVPAGDAGETPVEVEDTRRSLSRVDLELTLPVPYTPKTFPDDYRCFFLDWPEVETRYVTGFGIDPGNDAIVHHVIAYVVRPDNIATFQALDDADPEPGWPCFGGPGGDGPSQAAWIGGWAPGVNGEDNPPGTGIEVPAGSKVIVQMHYNSSSSAPEPDQTAVLLRIDDTVEKKGAILTLADPKWVMTDSMTIPAHMSDVVHSVALDPTVFVSFITGGVLGGGKPLTVYNAGMHMHTRGERGAARIERAGGETECLMDIPRWNFHWQGSYTFAEPKQVDPGEKIYLECQWDNPGDADLAWGEGTGDEMCLGLFYVTE